MQDSDMLNINSQPEHPQAENVGFGHSDQGQVDWAVDINLDFYASCIGRHPMLAYIALSENESIGRERYNFMQKLRPVVRENNRASEVLLRYREHAPNTSDTNTDADNATDTDSVNSRPQPVWSSPCRTAEAVLSDQEEPSEPSKTRNPGFNYAKATGLKTAAEAVLSDQEEPSGPSKTHNPAFDYAKETGLKTAAEAVLSDQEEPSEPSKTRNPGFDYAKETGLKTAAEAVLSDQEEPSEPSKTRNPGFDYAKETGLKTAAEAVLSDQKEPSNPSKARIPGFDYAKAFGVKKENAAPLRRPPERDED